MVARPWLLPVDQLAQAVSNFLLLLLLARLSDAAGFAVVSLAWLAYAIALNAHRVLVGEQVLVATRRKELDEPSLVMGATSLVVAVGYLVVVGTILIGVGAQTTATLAAGAASVLLLVDGVRVSCVAEGNTVTPLLMDVTWMIGVVVCGAAALSLGVTWLPLVSVVIPATWGLVRKGAHRPELSPALRFLQSLREYAGWTALQQVVINTASQFTVVLCLPWVTTSDFGGLRAVQALLSPVSTPAQAMQTYFLVQMVEYRAWGRWPRFLILTMAMAACSGAIFLAVTASGGLLVELGLGAEYLSYLPLVPPVAISFALVYLGMPVGVLMRIHRLGRTSALAQTAALGVGVVAVIGLSIGFGAHGAAWGIAVQGIASVAIAGLALYANRRVVSARLN